MTSRRRNVWIEATLAITRLIDGLVAGQVFRCQSGVHTDRTCRQAHSYTPTMARNWAVSSPLAGILALGAANFAIANPPDLARAWGAMEGILRGVESADPPHTPTQGAEIEPSPPGSLCLAEVRLWLGPVPIGRGSATALDAHNPVAAAAQIATEAAWGSSPLESLRSKGLRVSADQVLPELTMVFEPEELPAVEWSDLASSHAPGLDALWLTRTDAAETVTVFSLPQDQLASDADHVEGTMLTLAVRAGLRPLTLAELRRHATIRVGRASVLRAVAPAMGDGPTIVIRRHGLPEGTLAEQCRRAGQSIVGFLARSAPELDRVGDPAIRDSLIAFGLADRMNITSGEFGVVTAPAASQALAGWALLHAAGMVDDGAHSEAIRTALAALESLPRQGLGEADAGNSRIAGAIAVACVAEFPAELGGLSDTAKAWVQRAHARLTKSLRSGEAPVDGLRAVEVFAFAAAAGRSGDVALIDEARLQVIRAWDEFPHALLPSTTPWLLLAEQSLGVSPLRRELREKSLDIIQSLQWTDPGAGARQEDLVGAILTAAPPADGRGAPAVGASSALPAMALLLGGRDGPARRASQFLALLPVDRAGAVPTLPSGSGAVGAVGATPWSKDAAVGEAALVLRALAQSVQALETPSTAAQSPGNQPALVDP